MLQLLWYSGYLIAMLGLLHLVGFVVLRVWQHRKALHMKSHLANLVRDLPYRTDEDPTVAVEDQIASFLEDIELALSPQSSESVRDKLADRMASKDESRYYLHAQGFETVYSLLRTGIEAYPLLGILCTIWAIAVGMSGAATQPSAVGSASEAIMRNFGAAIGSTAAGLACAVVLMLFNAWAEPAVARFVEVRQTMRHAIRAARTRLDGHAGPSGDGGQLS